MSLQPLAIGTSVVRWWCRRTALSLCPTTPRHDITSELFVGLEWRNGLSLLHGQLDFFSIDTVLVEVYGFIGNLTLLPMMDLANGAPKFWETMTHQTLATPANSSRV